jgi:hypothetical protein
VFPDSYIYPKFYLPGPYWGNLTAKKLPLATLEKKQKIGIPFLIKQAFSKIFSQIGPKKWLLSQMG